jgi:hypothetical protein
VTYEGNCYSVPSDHARENRRVAMPGIIGKVRSKPTLFGQTVTLRQERGDAARCTVNPVRPTHVSEPQNAHIPTSSHERWPHLHKYGSFGIV